MIVHLLHGILEPVSEERVNAIKALNPDIQVKTRRVIPSDTEDEIAEFILGLDRAEEDVILDGNLRLRLAPLSEHSIEFSVLGDNGTLFYIPPGRGGRRVKMN